MKKLTAKDYCQHVDARDSDSVGIDGGAGSSLILVDKLAYVLSEMEWEDWLDLKGVDAQKYREESVKQLGEVSNITIEENKDGWMVKLSSPMSNGKEDLQVNHPTMRDWQPSSEKKYRRVPWNQVYLLENITVTDKKFLLSMQINDFLALIKLVKDYESGSFRVSDKSESE